MNFADIARGGWRSTIVAGSCGVGYGRGIRAGLVGLTKQFIMRQAWANMFYDTN